MTITIQPCDHRQLLEQIGELAVCHWQELETEFSDRVPAPHREVYDAMAAAGALIAFSATVDGAVVGYASAFLCRHPHYDMLLGQHDTLYLHPAHRNGSTGLRLMKAIEQEAFARGAERMMWTAKPGSAFERILQSKGYRTEETLYCKEL